MTTSIVPTLRTLSRALLGYDLKTSIRSQGRLISARILSTESEATREQLERVGGSMSLLVCISIECALKYTVSQL